MADLSKQAATNTQVLHAPITPGLNYRDAQAAMRWLEEVLGFRTAVLYEEDDGRVAFAQLEWRGGAIHLSTREEKVRRLPETGPSSIVLTAEDAQAVDRLYERAVAAGAEVMLPIEDTFYGNHGFSLRDPEGNLWHMGTPWFGSEAAKQLPQRRL
jgi:uncharacterized glyoxalase superfamily protein PhnB